MADTETIYDPEADLRPPPTAEDDQRQALRDARYGAARGAALDLQAIRDRNARSDMPAGSPTNYLDANKNPLGPVQYDEFQIPKPAPLAATGLRGYPSADEINAFNTRDVINAKADRFNADLNDTLSRYPAAPKFAMPTTDDLIDGGIQARRNQIQSAIDVRQNRLATESDSPTIIGGGTRHPVYAPSQASRTRGEMQILTQQAGQLDRAQQENITNKSRMALASAKQNEITSQDTARGQVVDFLNNIDDSRYPIGSPDREAFIGKVFGNRPDWLHVMAKDPHLSKYVQEHVDAHNTVANTINALKTAYPDEESLPNVGGVRMVPSVNAKGQVSYRGATGQTTDQKEEGKLAAMLHKTTGLTPDEFAAIDPSQVKAGGIFVGKPGEGVFHHTEAGFTQGGTPKGEFSNDFTKVIEGYHPGRPANPATKDPGEQGTQLTPEQEKQAKDMIASGGAIQIDTGRGYQATIPRSLYQSFLSKFGNQEAPSGGGVKKAMSLDDYRKSIGLDQQ